jgi:hypothetical protein
VPDWPLGLNTEPGAETEAPGVTGLSGPQVFVGAPGCPVVGVTSAKAAAPVYAIVATQKATTITPLTTLFISASLKFDGPRRALPKFRYSRELLQARLLAQLADEPDHGLDASDVLID